MFLRLVLLLAACSLILAGNIERREAQEPAAPNNPQETILADASKSMQHHTVEEAPAAAVLVTGGTARSTIESLPVTRESLAIGAAHVPKRSVSSNEMHEVKPGCCG